MKKMFKKVSAAAMSAALVLGNGVMLSAYATEGDVTTTVAATEAATEATTSLETTAAATEATTEAATTAAEATTSTTAVTEAVTTAADQGFFAGTFYATSSSYQGYNTYGFTSDGKSGSYINSVSGATATFTATYTNGSVTLNFANSSKTGTLSNITGSPVPTGFTVTWSNGEVETFSSTIPSTATTAATTAAGTTASSAAASTTAAPTTTKAATTTAKPNKNDSPKTGDSFPALAITAALLSAAGLSLVTRKKND